MIKKKRFIRKYCNKHQCSLKEFSEKINISYSIIRMFDRTENNEVRLSTATKLFFLAKKHFGEPILPWDLTTPPNMIPKSFLDDVYKRHKGKKYEEYHKEMDKYM